MNHPRRPESQTPRAGSSRVIVAAVLIAGVALLVVGLWWARRPTGGAGSEPSAGEVVPDASARETPPVAEASPPAYRPEPGPASAPEPLPSADPIVAARVDEIAAGLAQAAALAVADPAEARRYLEQLAERFPRNERILAALATSLDGTDDARAREIALRCLDVNPASVQCSTVMFTTFQRAGDFDAGLPYVNRCISVDSSDTRCLSALMDTRIHRGELEEARAVSDRIHEQTDGGLAVYATAQVAEASGHGADALRGYQEACSEGYDAGCARAAALAADGGR